MACGIHKDDRHIIQGAGHCWVVGTESSFAYVQRALIEFFGLVEATISVVQVPQVVQHIRQLHPLRRIAVALGGPNLELGQIENSVTVEEYPVSEAGVLEYLAKRALSEHNTKREVAVCDPEPARCQSATAPKSVGEVLTRRVQT